MIELQQASAGSGKTFALARKFIWYYITIPYHEGGRKRRLRTPDELEDSLDHILAVTFTNKATNEMQQRIVEKLYQLGYGRSDGKTPDYLNDFLDLLSTPETDRESLAEKIAITARRAVALLLNNYSEFHVSTIDSFFQQVLRTFAYESDLKDSYRIEIDSDALSTVAIDSLLESINAGTDTTGAAFWIGELMERARLEGKKWNLFAKSTMGSNPYAMLINSVKRLENEEFKSIRREIDSYFAEDIDFKAIYQNLKTHYEPTAEEKFRSMQKAVSQMKRALEQHGGAIQTTDHGKFTPRIKKVEGADPGKVPAEKDFLKDFDPGDAYQKRKAAGDTGAYNALEAADLRMTECYYDWLAYISSPEYRTWRLYRENLPFLGLMQAIRDKRDEYLRETNAIELGETNSMLADIISEDDAPFIYERIGSRLNHFLIDEFQDTSRMQWRNMSPLLHESTGRGNENLIIGDAKQSIYRFRNADSSLISRAVPEEFGLENKELSTTTNWRSDRRIVQFNNSLFSRLPQIINTIVGYENDPRRRDFTEDYRSVVQIPHHRGDRGYVWVKASDQPNEEALEDLTHLIEDAMSRGYRMKDIAILVRTRQQGENVIARLTDYNARPDRRHTLEFVSEQSLRLQSSMAVNVVVSVLRTIASGADPEVRTGEERKKKGVADWQQMMCNYRFFALRNPELATPESLERFFSQGSDNSAIPAMLDKMQAVSLPALVESISAEFLTPEQRRHDGVFLAAFQDMVLEYCDSHPSDLTSFLEWWGMKSEKASISSPDDMDAIRVMTIHKSKGLEFPIVIVPYTDETFEDKIDKEEWRWVAPVELEGAGGQLPPYIPVATGKSVEGTAHETILHHYLDLVKMDILNSLYVAFTRASSELYIYSRCQADNAKTLNPLRLGNLIKEFFRTLPVTDDPNLMNPDEAKEDDSIFTYGAPGRKDKEKETPRAERIIEEYTCVPTPDFLSYRTEDVDLDPEDPMANDPSEGIRPDPAEEYEGDTDALAEGNMLHQILEGVESLESLPRAVRRLVLSGQIAPAHAARLEGLLREAIDSAAVREWFDGSCRILAERSLLHSGRGVKRPDRVMIDRDGNAIVVDYKFGLTKKALPRYRRQVAGYMRALRETGLYRNVRGFIWYVRLSDPEEVEFGNESNK